MKVSAVTGLTSLHETRDLCYGLHLEGPGAISSTQKAEGKEKGKGGDGGGAREGSWQDDESPMTCVQSRRSVGLSRACGTWSLLAGQWRGQRGGHIAVISM